MLIADDVTTNALVLEAHLSESYDVRVAEGGHQALEICAEWLPDLALLDVDMPDMSGFEVCRQLRASSLGSDLVIIFITGSRDDVADGFEVGGDDYLVKPIRPAELHARLRTQLERRSLLAQLESAKRGLETRVEERTAELTTMVDKLQVEISLRRLMEERLDFLTRHDLLTRLYNRESLLVKLTEQLTGGEGGALDYVDLDRFRTLNSSIGPQFGDRVLADVASLLRRSVSPDSVLARVGPDMFAVLMKERGDVALQRAEELREAITKLPIRVESTTFPLSASIGVSFIEDASSAYAAFAMADELSRLAKEDGRNRVRGPRHSSSSTLNEIKQSAEWVTKLPTIIADDQLQLFYQEIVPLQDPEEGKYIEVLLRLPSDNGEFVPPSVFLGAAERFDMMAEIDRWVIRKAIGTLVEHSGELDKIRKCSLNLSAQTLGTPALVDEFEALLRAHPEIATKISFEITETSAVRNLAGAVQVIERFRALGCGIALDDFGSGFASYAYLRALPVDTVKIDGVFVRDMLTDETNAAMIRSMTEIGRVTGKTIIAEFVETTEIAEQLREIGVHYAQGWAYHKPVPLKRVFE